MIHTPLDTDDVTRHSDEQSLLQGGVEEGGKVHLWFKDVVWNAAADLYIWGRLG